MKLTFEITTEEAIQFLDWWGKLQAEQEKQHPLPPIRRDGNGVVFPEYYEGAEIPKDWTGYKVDPKLSSTEPLSFCFRGSVVHVDKGDFISLCPVSDPLFRLMPKSDFLIRKDKHNR